MSLVFGWCLPGINQHESCIGSFEWNGSVVCPCSCHGATDTPSEEDVVD